MILAIILDYVRHINRTDLYDYRSKNIRNRENEYWK